MLCNCTSLHGNEGWVLVKTCFCIFLFWFESSGVPKHRLLCGGFFQFPAGVVQKAVLFKAAVVQRKLFFSE